MSGRLRRLVRICRDAVLAVLAVAFLYVVLHFTGIGCPIRFMTGISCPGCGMTRALFAAATFHFRKAFAYHPLWFMVPIWGVIMWKRSKIDEKIYRFFGIITVILFALVYFLRLFDKNDIIVVFEPWNGFVFRIIINLLRRWVL